MRQIVWGVLLTGLMSTSAMAQEPATTQRLDLRGALAGSFNTATVPAIQDPAAEPDPAVTVIGGVDFPSSYFFRGYRQEGEPELTIQPFIDFGFAASENVTIN